MEPGPSREAISLDRHAAQAIGVISNGGSDAALTRALGYVFGRVVHIIRYPQGPITRASAIVRTNEPGVVVLLAGVNGNTSLNLIRGYVPLSEVQAVGGFNFQAAVEASTRFQPILEEFCAVAPNLYIYGHSGGGVVAEVLSVLANNRKWATHGRIATFGAPKPGVAGCSGQNGSQDHIRWVNVDDPVPGIPFGRMAAAIAPPSRLIVTGDTFNQMAQAPDGTITDASGSGSAIGRGLVRPYESLSDVEIWAIGPDSGRIHAHRIEEYVRRLERSERTAQVEEQKEAGMPAITTVQQVRGIARRDGPQNLVMPFMLRGIAAFTSSRVPPGVMAAFGGGGRGQNMKIFIPAELRPKHQNVGGIWCVVWLTQIVARFDTASKARSHSRGLYRACRTALASSLYYTGAAAVAWDTFFQAASTAGSGIKPTINLG